MVGGESKSLMLDESVCRYILVGWGWVDIFL